MMWKNIETGARTEPGQNQVHSERSIKGWLGTAFSFVFFLRSCRCYDMICSGVVHKSFPFHPPWFDLWWTCPKWTRPKWTCPGFGAQKSSVQTKSQRKTSFDWGKCDWKRSALSLYRCSFWQRHILHQKGVFLSLYLYLHICTMWSFFNSVHSR